MEMESKQSIPVNNTRNEKLKVFPSTISLFAIPLAQSEFIVFIMLNVIVWENQERLKIMAMDNGSNF